ncbi:unnamed protein product [Lampetra fluviatilis]
MAPRAQFAVLPSTVKPLPPHSAVGTERELSERGTAVGTERELVREVWSGWRSGREGTLLRPRSPEGGALSVLGPTEARMARGLRGYSELSHLSQQQQRRPLQATALSSVRATFS